MVAVSSSLRLLYAAWLLVGPARAFRAKKPDAGARLSNALERLGPAYIKLGQMLATRPDIVGAEMATALEHLQDRLPPFAETEARTEITRAFGKPVEALFSSFGGALAAASIAQVHRAQTSDTPPVRVAVKILRPKVREQFARDLQALAFFARMAETFSGEARRLRFTAIVATLADSVALELDLRMEAAAAGELYERTRGEEPSRPSVDPRVGRKARRREPWRRHSAIRKAARLQDLGRGRAAQGHPLQLPAARRRDGLARRLSGAGQYRRANVRPGHGLQDGRPMHPGRQVSGPGDRLRRIRTRRLHAELKQRRRRHGRGR